MENSAPPGRFRRDMVWPVLCAAVILALTSLEGTRAAALRSLAESAVRLLIRTMFSTDPSAAAALAVNRWTVRLMMICLYALLTLLGTRALVRRGTRLRPALAVMSAAGVLLAAADELHQLFVPGHMPSMLHGALDCAGVGAAAAGILLARRLARKAPRVFNRETVNYVIFGVLTTVVNMVAYGVCYNLWGIHNLISNAIAWVAAVLFAYVVNKLFVFRIRTASLRALAREFWLFIAARLLSFGLDEFCMWLLVNVLAFNSGVSKIFVNVIVMIMNYFFSKLIIFRGTPAVAGENPSGPDKTR